MKEAGRRKQRQGRIEPLGSARDCANKRENRSVRELERKRERESRSELARSTERSARTQNMHFNASVLSLSLSLARALSLSRRRPPLSLTHANSPVVHSVSATGREAVQEELQGRAAAHCGGLGTAQ
eukprot:6188982-Pleurochrysis_carterae.AAC.1